MANGDSSSRRNESAMNQRKGDTLLTVGILTISDRGAQGVYADQSGPALRKVVTEQLGARVVCADIVPDERALIADKLREWADELKVHLILTTGGTGFAPRDITPEATGDVIERDAPGFAEAMRAAGMKVTPHAMLSRARAGIRGRSLIINLPGSPKAAVENLQSVLAAIPHGVELLQETAGADDRHTYRGESRNGPARPPARE